MTLTVFCLTVGLMALACFYRGYPDIVNNVTQLGRMTLGTFQMVEDLLCAMGMLLCSLLLWRKKTKHVSLSEKGF